MIIQYIDESTFLSEEIEVSDELYETAIDIRKQYMSSVLSDCSNIMLAKDKKTLKHIKNFYNIAKVNKTQGWLKISGFSKFKEKEKRYLIRIK